VSIIPLHLQRRFEQRWAARFGSLVIASRTKERRIEGSPANIARRGAKAKKNPPKWVGGQLVLRV
jgi:hypothetical protein